MYRYGTKASFYEFLTGGAGTGKTVVLRIIAELSNRMHNNQVGIDPSSIKVLLVAFTGSAAFNVRGTTIHHAFRIPFGCRLLPYKKFPSEERCKMRDDYLDLLWLIIDEVSMTGATLLFYIHRRLQDVFENGLPFRGVSILAFGDLYQLKPVGENYCFQGIDVKDSNRNSFTLFNLWSDLFSMYELTRIMRQKHGLSFAETLNRLRVVDHTPEDLQLLKQFEIDLSDPPPDYSIFERHIFATHRQRDDHNLRVLDSIKLDEVHIECRDSVLAPFVTDRDCRYFLQKAKRMDDTKTATLFSELSLKSGMILEVTTNVDVLDELFNGAWSVLSYIDPPGTSSPNILWVAFADPLIGRQVRALHRSLDNARTEVQLLWTPIFRISQKFQVTSRHESVILRWQFPVRPATAGTFHHNQGLTLKRGAVNFRGPRRFAKMAGRHYVGYSRFSDAKDNLHVLDSAFEEIHFDPRVHVEMNRLRLESRTLKIFDGLQEPSNFSCLIQCVLHSTRSL
jgi:hypothetical protein